MHHWCRQPYEPEEGNIIEESVFANQPIWFLVRNCILRILDLSLSAFELFEFIGYGHDPEWSMDAFGARSQEHNVRLARFV